MQGAQVNLTSRTVTNEGLIGSTERTTLKTGGRFKNEPMGVVASQVDLVSKSALVVNQGNLSARTAILQPKKGSWNMR